MNRVYLFQDLISPHHLFNKFQYTGDERWHKLERPPPDFLTELGTRDTEEENN